MTYAELEPGQDVDHNLRRRFWWTYIAAVLGFIGCVLWGVL